MSANKKYDFSDREVRVTGVPATIASQLTNIADHLGVSRAEFLKPKLYDILNSYPEHMRQPFSKD